MRMTLEGLQQNSVYYVQLRTKYRDRTGEWSRRFELVTDKDLVKPGPVTNLAGVFNEGNLTLSWARPAANEDGSPLEDLKDYVVTITPVPKDPEWPPFVIYAEGTKAVFTKEQNAAAFGRYRAGLKIVVQARDIVNNLSEPVEIVKNKPKPKPVTGLVWEPKDNAFVGSWVAPTENTDGSPFTDPDGYELRVIYISPNGFENVVTKIIPSKTFTFSYEDNKAAFGGPDLPPRARGKLTLEVRARDSVGQLSEPVTLTAQNSPPKKVTGVVAKAMVNSVRIEWNANDQEDSVAYYEVWIANNPTAIGVFGGRTTTNFYIYDTAVYDQDHYFYVYAVDDFSLTSDSSEQIAPVRPLSPFGVDIDPPAKPTQNSASTTTEIAGRSTELPAAIQVSWVTPTLPGDPTTPDPSIAGYHISYSLDTNPRVWEYKDVIVPTETSAIISPLVPRTEYVIRLRTYDQFVNTSAWSDEFRGTSTISTSDFQLSDISSDISIITGGTLRSQNYDEVAKTGWRLMPSGLDIHNGSVNAAVIRTGELRSNVLQSTGQPLWTLNLDGNLTVRSARVKGQLLVGEASADPNEVTNPNMQIASHNVGATTGSWWSLRGDGTFTTRSGGTNERLELSSRGLYGFDSTNTARIILNTLGQFSLQTTNGGLVFDDNGLRLYQGSTLSVDLNRTGSAFFRGRIEAGSGVVGGWSLLSNELSGGNLRLRSDLGMIYGGSATSFVGMRAGVGFWAGQEDGFSNTAPFQVYVDGSLRSTRGSIAGFTINATAGLRGGVNSSTVAMSPGEGIWTGSNTFSIAPVRMHTDGTFFASKATIEGNVYARLFRSNASLAGYSNYIEIGDTGLSDRADEIRFFYGSTRSSIRNPSHSQGSMFISCSSGGSSYTYNFTGNGNGLIMGGRLNMNTWDIRGVRQIYSSDSMNTNINMSAYGMDFRVHQMGGYGFTMFASQEGALHGNLRYGSQSMLKFLSSGPTVQVRVANDSGYGYMAAIINNVSSGKFKANIEDWHGDALGKINDTPVRQYNRIIGPPAARGGPARLSEYTVIGPVLEEMPEELRLDPSGDTYDVGAAIGLIWKAVQELDQKKMDRSQPDPVAPPEPAQPS